MYECFKRKGLHFLHFNAQSLFPKLPEIRLIAQQSNATAICITETWIDSTVSDEEIKIDQYSVIRNDRNRHGGGVCIYIRTDIPFNPRDDFKTARITPLYKKNSKLEIGNYRPVSVLNCVSKILEKCVYIQVENYLSSKDLIYQYQSGFSSRIFHRNMSHLFI